LVESAARNHAGFIVTTQHHRILSHSNPSAMVGTFGRTARISSLSSIIGLRHPSKAAAGRKTRLFPGIGVGTVLSLAPTGRRLETHDDNDRRMRRRSTTRTHWWPFLERPHERGIFAFYGITGSAIMWICFSSSKSTGTTMAAAPLILAETGIALTWASMILAISFLEAWVKFRAPFLRKHVAVDVGRHVFAALNAAELGLCGSFWLGRVIMVMKLGQIRGQEGAALTKCLWKYCRQPCFVLPAVATASLLVEVIWIAPRLFLRAKARIVSEFRGEQQKNDGLLPSELLSGDEQLEFDNLAQQVHQHQLPSQQWHRVYALLELVKVVCLYSLVVRRWMDLVIL